MSKPRNHSAGQAAGKGGVRLYTLEVVPAERPPPAASASHAATSRANVSGSGGRRSGEAVDPADDD